VEITAACAKFHFYCEGSAWRSWTVARQASQACGLNTAMVKTAKHQAELHPQLQALCPKPWYSIGSHQQVKDGLWCTRWDPDLYQVAVAYAGRWRWYSALLGCVGGGAFVLIRRSSMALRTSHLLQGMLPASWSTWTVLKYL
jgi:hypothetical protein